MALKKKEAAKEFAEQWGPDHDQAHAKVKQLLTQSPVLQFPDFAPLKQAQEHSSPKQKGEYLMIIAYYSHCFK